MEQTLVEVLGEKVRAAEMRRRETRRIGGKPELQIALDVPTKEAVHEVAKDPVVVSRVVRGDNASSRYGIDDVDLVEKTSPRPSDRHARIAQCLERAVGKRRGAHTPARKTEHDQHIVGIGRIVGNSMQAVPLLGIVLPKRSV